MARSDHPGRRAFCTLLAAAALLPVSALAAPRKRARRSPHRPMKNLIKPPRLQPGDTVALIAPGGYATEKSIAKARRNIEALG
jgi:muramoyltetrapeptide carboxypeptidase